MDKSRLPKGWKVVTYDDLNGTKEKKKIKNELEEDFPDAQYEETPLYTKSYKVGKNEKGFFVSHYYDSSEPFWKRNLIPFLLEVIFILSCFYFPQYIIYSNFAFLMLLFIFFIVTKSFSFKSWGINLREGLYFWREVCITTLLYCAAFAITDSLEKIFPTLETGYLLFNLNGPLQIILFAVSSLFLAPIAEECFFRQGLISGESRKMLMLTAVVSLILFAVEHAFAPWGIFLVMMWALPLTWAYLKTRNIYIVITAHLIVNFIGNIPEIISAIF